MNAYSEYPTSILIDRQEYEVVTDFRDWIRFIELTKDKSLDKADKISMSVLWYKNGFPHDIKAMMNGLIRFMQNDDGKEKKNRPVKKKKVVDFVLDADYIAAGFLQAYGIDLQEVKYMHWYKFLSLFRALPSDTEIMDRIKYRSIDASKIKNREERIRIRRIQADIDLPQEEMTDEEIGNAFMF